MWQKKGHCSGRALKSSKSPFTLTRKSRINQQLVTVSDPGPRTPSIPSITCHTVPMPFYLPLTAVNTTGNKAGLKRGRGNLKEQKPTNTLPGKGGIEGWVEQEECNLGCLFSILSSALECANQDINVGHSLLELSSQSSVARHGLEHCESEV